MSVLDGGKEEEKVGWENKLKGASGFRKNKKKTRRLAGRNRWASEQREFGKKISTERGQQKNRGGLPSGSPKKLKRFSTLQHAQQHPHSNALVRSSYLNANTTNISSLSHKQMRGAQSNSSNILTSTTQLQQPQKQHNSLPNSHKLEADAPSVASQNSYSHRNVYGQNLTIPVQPVNLSFGPSTAPDSTSGNGRNFGENQQQLLHQH